MKQYYKGSSEGISNSQSLDVNEINADYVLQIPRFHMKVLRVWPLSSTSYFDKFLTIIIVTLHSLLILLVFIPGCLHTYGIVKDVSTIIQQSAMLNYCVTSILKYIILLTKQQTISNCIQHLSYDWKKITSIDDRNIMVKYAKSGRWGSIVLTMFVHSSAFFYTIIMPWSSEKARNEHNLYPEQNITVRPIAIPSYYMGLKPQGDIIYIIIFISQFISDLVMTTLTSASCSIAMVFTAHACGQLRILIDPLENFIKNPTGKEKLEEIISSIIQHHTGILRFINDIKEIMDNISFVDIAGSTVIICLLEYYLLLVWEESDAIGIIVYGLICMAVGLNIYILCNIGELLSNECREVGNTAYAIEWYKLPAKYSRQIKLIILTAQNPVAITAGKFIDLSYANFLTVMKTSIVYFNIIRTQMTYENSQ